GPVVASSVSASATSSGEADETVRLGSGGAHDANGCLPRPRWLHVHASDTARTLDRPEEAASVKAIAIHATGDVDVPQLEDVDRPERGEGEVLIRVHAAAVNPIDWKYRGGIADRPLPAVLGEEVSGTVELS